MGYYLRAFCLSDELPPLCAAFEAAAEEGVELRLARDHDAVDVEAADWGQAAIIYAGGRRPFLAEMHRAAEADGLVAEEVEEFSALLDGVPDTPEKARVLDQLTRTRAVVATQLLGDPDPALTPAATFLAFFVNHCGGLVQADGVGFFEGDELIVEVD